MALRAVDTACRAGAPPQGGRAAAWFQTSSSSTSLILRADRIKRWDLGSVNCSLNSPYKPMYY